MCNRHQVKLTNREIQVLGLLCDGYDSKEVAAKLGISPFTVIAYRKSIHHKAGIAKNTELGAWAVRAGFVPLHLRIV